jgi:DNA-binding PadR family transcriptional regulator
MVDRRAEDELPLTSLSFSILLALADGDQHGYGIMKSIELESGPRFRPSAGSLYAALDRLLGDELIAESPGRTDRGDDPRRRYYALTSFGRAVLRAEAERLARAVSSASRKKLLKSPIAGRKVARTSEP